MWRAEKITFPVIGIALAALLLLHPASSEAFRLTTARGSEEVRPVLQYINTNRADGDKLYVYPGARKAFLYYADRFQIADSEYTIGSGSAYKLQDLQLYVDDINRFSGEKRVWFFFSNVKSRGLGVKSGARMDEEMFYIYQLDNIGVRLDTFRVKNAVAYLYDLSGGSNAVSSSTSHNDNTAFGRK